MESRELTFPKDYLDSFTKLVEKTNKKARKFGTLEANMAVIDEFERTVRYESIDYAGIVEFVTVRISNLETPSYAGYKFIGKISNVDGIPQIHEAADINIPKEFTDEPQWNRCDHCNTKHQRKHLFVVENETTNEMMQVGRACVKDFTGHANAAQAVENMMTFLAEAEKYENDFSDDDLAGHAKVAAPLMDVLMASIKEIDEYGFVPRNSIDQVPTADRVYSQIFGTAKASDYKDALSTANEIVEWVHNEIDPKEEKNDWEYNVSQIFQKENVTSRHLGIVASVYNSYKKAQQAKNQIEVCNEWVGEVKERSNYTLKIVAHRITDGYYGMVHVYNFSDEEGHQFVWFGSKELDANEGDWVNVKATVKKHGEYKGIKQTQLTRVQIQ